MARLRNQQLLLSVNTQQKFATASDWCGGVHTREHRSVQKQVCESITVMMCVLLRAVVPIHIRKFVYTYVSAVKDRRDVQTCKNDFADADAAAYAEEVTYSLPGADIVRYVYFQVPLYHPLSE